MTNSEIKVGDIWICKYDCEVKVIFVDEKTVLLEAQTDKKDRYIKTIDDFLFYYERKKEKITTVWYLFSYYSPSEKVAFTANFKNEDSAKQSWSSCKHKGYHVSEIIESTMVIEI